jgi:hypothetical protein
MPLGASPALPLFNDGLRSGDPGGTREKLEDLRSPQTKPAVAVTMPRKAKCIGGPGLTLEFGRSALAKLDRI